LDLKQEIQIVKLVFGVFQFVLKAAVDLSELDVSISTAFVDTLSGLLAFSTGMPTTFYTFSVCFSLEFFFKQSECITSKIDKGNL
jgi:hypothetical protein